MWIIPCRFNPETPIVYECVERIQLHHPDDKILVIDSDSEDKSYMDRIHNDYGVEVLAAKNRNYALNAYYLGYQAYPLEEYYYCIHDSMLVNSSMKQFEVEPLTVLRHFCSPPTGMGADDKGEDLTLWAEAKLQQHVKIGVPEYYYGVFGPIFFAQNQVMKELVLSGFFDIICEIKHHMSAMERMIGIVFSHLGYDVSHHSLQGEMLDFWGKYDATFAQKEYLMRP